MSITCIPVTVARNRSASQRAYSRAALACSDPSSATRMFLIMGLAWAACTTRLPGRASRARVFFGAEGHLSVEELYAAVKRVNPRVGYATVYRTLKLLKECGLAAERHFDDGQARYEPVEDDQQHHDHIICERCGKIVEFASEELERLQERIGRFLGFVVGRHRMELYGMCAECREGLGPGRYEFFDDFHQQRRGALLVR